MNKKINENINRIKEWWNKSDDYKPGREISSKEKTVILPWEDVSENSNYNSPLFNQIPPLWKQEDYLKAAKGWVYACVSAIADEIATINLQLYKRTSKGIEEILEHPIIDLLNRVNDFTTKSDHFGLTQQYLELVGEAPWLLQKEGGIPVSMYLLRPDKLTIKFDKKKIIGGYIYEISPGNKESFESEDIIFLKYPSPIRPLRGRGTLEAAIQTVDLDKYAEEWNVQFFFNAARPDAILTTEGKLTKEQRDSLHTQWKKQFQGINKRAKLAILESGLKYQQMQLTQKDMDFLEQQKFSRDKIFSIFRVPKSVIAISDNVNRANAETGAYAFARWTIRPKMKKIVEQLNEFLVPMFSDSEDLFLDFEDPVPENVEMKIKKYHEALHPQSGWMTINEVREKEGLLPVENGDSIVRPMTAMPTGQGEEKQFTLKIKKPDKIIYKKIIKKKILPEKKVEEITESIKNVVRAHLQKEKNHSNDEVKKK